MIYYLKHNIHKLNWTMIGYGAYCASLFNGVAGHCGFDLSRRII